MPTIKHPTGECPLCKTFGKATLLLAPDLCPSCGSLEGLDETRDLKVPSCLVGHDWASGSLAPWRTQDGKVTYATPTLLARAALTKAGLQPLADQRQSSPQGVVIDLGCGDAQILREAAAHFGCRGIGLDIDESALNEARDKVRGQGLEDLVTVRAANFMEVDMPSVVGDAQAQGRDSYSDSDSDSVGINTSAQGAYRVILTTFLLPQALEHLRSGLQHAVSHCGATLITFTWDFGSRWEGPYPGERDLEGKFTIYRPQLHVQTNRLTDTNTISDVVS